MNINIGANCSQVNEEAGINLTIDALIEKLDLKNRNKDIMFTMTLFRAHRGGSMEVQFRAWVSPFRNFCSNHVNRDGAPGNNVLFEIIGESEEILEAVNPLIKDKVEWQTVKKEDRVIRLWLSEKLGY